jgi:hypothetical protein
VIVVACQRFGVHKKVICIKLRTYLPIVIAMWIQRVTQKCLGQCFCLLFFIFRSQPLWDCMQLLLEPILYSNKTVVVTAYQKLIILRTYVRFSSLPKFRFDFKFIQYCILMFDSLKSPWPQPKREFILLYILLLLFRLNGD